MEQDIWDGPWKLFRHDPITRQSIWMLVQDDRTVFRIDQPLEDIFAVNHEFEAVSQGERFGDFNRIASIPHHLVHSSGLAEANRQGDQKFINRWMNDIDNRKFRTSRGKV